MNNSDKIKCIERMLVDYAVDHAANVAFYHTHPNDIKVKLFDSTTEKWYAINPTRIEGIVATIEKIIADFEAHRKDIASLYPRCFAYTDGTERIVSGGTLDKLVDRINAVNSREYALYCEADVENTRQLYEAARKAIFEYNGISLPEIEDVIFNDPATIIFWKDGTKTVVKTQNGEAYDPEKGMAMAISKKVLGNDYGYYETFARHIGRYEKRKKKEAAK